MIPSKIFKYLKKRCPYSLSSIDKRLRLNVQTTLKSYYTVLHMVMLTKC
jgi:hypothetical protein